MAGQTLSEIRSLLASHGLSPRHRYGQNFLIDLNLMRKLVAAAELTSADVVLEVGPGTGSLTELLLESGAQVISVEIDAGLAGVLRERLGERPNFRLVEGDALCGKHGLNPLALSEIRVALADRGALKLVANLPYAIATPVLMNLVQSDLPWSRVVCTIQKEVGERILAEEGSEAYGVLSVILRSHAHARVIATLPPRVFWPAPEVESVMLLLTPHTRRLLQVDEVAPFSNVVHEAFLHRRKKLRRLVKRFGEEQEKLLFDRVGISADARPEDLSPTAWQAFFRELRALHS